MKKFLLQLLSFSLFPIIYFGLNSIINIYIYSTTDIYLNNNVIIIGDSHPQKSLNPDLFFDARNISQPAEPYVLTYWKIKKILNDTKLDTLIIGFAPHNISAFNDFKFSNSKWSHQMFKRIYTIERFDELDDNIKVDYFEFYKLYWKQIGFYPKKNHFYFMGNYSNNELSDISDWKAAINRHYYYKNEKLGISKASISYLDSIITICITNSVIPILVSNPVQQNYLNNIPSNILTTYKNLNKKYVTKGIKVVDKRSEFYPDSLFLNSNHLNSIGSKRFTNEIIEIIKHE